MTDDAALPSPEAPRRRARAALWGALAVLAVAAGAVAVARGDGDGGSLGSRLLPIALDSAGGSTAEGRATGPAADMAMLADVHYTAADDLPLLGGEGRAYRLPGGVDRAALRAVARALGIDGEPVHEPEMKDSWTVRDGDRLLSATSWGGQWWYSSDAPQSGPGAGSSGSAGSSETSRGSAGAGRDEVVVDPVEPESAPCPPAAACIDPMPPATRTEPAPPTDLPSEAEARQIATDLFAEVGVDLAGSDVVVEGPYDSWYVSATPRVGGVPVSGYGFTANVGPKGEILSAAGVLGQPEDLGRYPTVDTRAAVDRLNAGSGVGRRTAGAAGAEAGAVEDLAVDDAPADAPVASTEPACPAVDLAADGGAAEPACGPTDPQPVEPVQPIEVVLHRAERILVLVPATDDSGDTYLVPGYRMHGEEEGQVVEVPSIDDESILPTPTTDPCAGGTPWGTDPDGEVLCEHGEPAAPSAPDAPVSSPARAGGATPADQ
jgi:hypothetical protein